MSDKNKVQLFENKKIRTAWAEEKEDWYFSIVDILTESKESRMDKSKIAGNPSTKRTN